MQIARSKGDTCWNYIGIRHAGPQLHPWLPVTQVAPQHEEKKTSSICQMFSLDVSQCMKQLTTFCTMKSEINKD